MFAVRFPSGVVKFSRIKCGFASETVPMSWSLTSCRITVLLSPKYAVGPNGMWLTTRPSGSPLCSCTTTKSVKSLLLHSSTKSGSTCAPRLIRRLVGISSFTSLTNCVRRDDGSRDVVTKTLGSRSFARAYSSSALAPFAAVDASSSAISLRKLASAFRSSVGMTLPSSRHCRIFRFFSYSSRSLPSRDLR